MNNLMKDVKQVRLENGLMIKLIDDNTSSEYYANLTVKYGSNDTEFSIDGKNYQMQSGIAHFLEHVMFHNFENDYFDNFSQFFANANAYTTYNQTSYLFSSNGNFIKNLVTLHEMVTELRSNNQLVNKEREIINQELNMYSQIPDEKLENLSNEVSTNTNYKNDIGGKIKTIQTIDYEDLNFIFENFYTYNNMTLYLSGNFENIDIISEVRTIFDKTFIQKKIAKLQKQDTIFPIVNKTIKQKNIEFSMQKVVIRLSDFLNESDVIYFKSFINGIFSELNVEFEKLIKNNILNESFYSYCSFKKNFNTLNFGIYDFDGDFKKIIESLILSKTKQCINMGHKKLIATEIRSSNVSNNFIKKIAHMDYESYDTKKYYELLTEELKSNKYNLKYQTHVKFTKKS